MISLKLKVLTNFFMILIQIFFHIFVSFIPQTNELIEEQLKNQPIDSMLSPLPLNNNNNNHVDSLPYPLPQHTYATHKLPSFTEMIESQKTRQTLPTVISDEKPVPNLTILNASQNNLDKIPNTDIESNGGYENDDESSLHAIDLSTTSGSLVIHGKKPNECNSIDDKGMVNGNEKLADDITINQYIAKNPNLTFKGSGDIMNMDIIFENVSIEEDDTIGNVTTEQPTLSSSSSSSTTVAVAETPIVTTISESQIENVNIDCVEYEIITLDKETSLCDDKLISNTTETIENASTITIINDDTNYVYSSNEMVIMPCSSLDVAAEIDAVDESNVEQTIILPESNSYETVTVPLPESTEEIVDLKIKNETTAESITVQNNSNERKRKRKAVPVLANSKRVRRHNANVIVDNKTESTVSSNENLMSSNEKTSENDQIDATACDLTTSSTTITDQIVEQTQANDETDNQTKNETTSIQSCMDSLVVVESQDPNDPNRTIHEVYVVDPDTNEMSDKPLDLPEHVIQRIRLAMS